MNIILLSGGSGKRLWPLSNDIRSKQFLKLFKNKDGNYESMLQRIYKQICTIDKNAKVTIATSKMQVEQIRSQLNDSVGISVEPERRDTFPAIVLATAYLKEVMNVDENESVVVCPVDPYVDNEYFSKVNELYEISNNSDSNLVLMGINPTYPSEKFGYIIPENNESVSKVCAFKEKPTVEVAKEYIKNNGLWNGGVFAFKIKYLLQKAHELIEFKDYQDLYNKYGTLKKISFDYEVVEKEKKISVARFNGKWEDLGTWNALVEKMEDKVIGNAILSNTCNNVNVINELNVPIMCIGLNDIIVVSTLNGVLITSKNETDSLKQYVDKVEDEPRYIENEWGNLKIIEKDSKNKIIKAFINKSKKIELQKDLNCNEKIVVLSGNGKLLQNEAEKEICTLDEISINNTIKIEAVTDIELLIIKVKKEEN